MPIPHHMKLILFFMFRQVVSLKSISFINKFIRKDLVWRTSGIIKIVTQKIFLILEAVFIVLRAHQAGHRKIVNESHSLRKTFDYVKINAYITF